MSEEPHVDRNAFRFSMANMLRAVTCFAIGWGASAALFRFRDHADFGLLGVAGTAGFFISAGIAMGALGGQTKAGIAFGIFLFVAYILLAFVVAAAAAWYFG